MTLRDLTIFLDNTRLDICHTTSAARQAMRFGWWLALAGGWAGSMLHATDDRRGRQTGATIDGEVCDLSKRPTGAMWADGLTD